MLENIKMLFESIFKVTFNANIILLCTLMMTILYSKNINSNKKINILKIILYIILFLFMIKLIFYY
jgi:hypothetical protein